MALIDVLVFFFFVVGVVFLILYYKNEKFDSDFILIFSIVLILTSLYFIFQKLIGNGSKSKDGFSAWGM